MATTSESAGSPTTRTKPLPENCPTSQDLGVEWPRALDASSVATFVESYEETYYREVVFEFDPESRFSRVGSAIARVQDVAESGAGWRVRFAGILGIEEAITRLEASPAEPPDDEPVIPIGDVDNEQLSDLLVEAAESGGADDRISAGETDAYIDRLEALSETFELSAPEYRETLYFAVDGTTIELSVGVDTLHVDREWNARYYVDPHVVWRAAEPDIDPREGVLLECRPGD